jgi:hypothetical protein
MKTFVLTVSRVFPKTHKQAGNPTRFIEKILNKEPENWTKIHTIRANYDLWKNRIDQVNEGKAILSLRYWTGSPYNYQRDGSKQGVFLTLGKGECGIQKIIINEIFRFKIDDSPVYPSYDLGFVAQNDGLSYDDFIEWFREYDKIEPMAVIHFTGFRY